MNNNFFSFIIIPIIVLTVMAIARFIRKKMAKPDYQEEVQTPGKFDNFILKFITGLTIFSGLLAILGAVIREIEMAIVFLVLTLIFLGIVLILRNAYDLSYQETDEYFILKVKNKEYKVFYENIIDWQPSLNEIKILDESRADGEYIRVNISMFKPEILLQKIVEMTFTGKFQRLDDNFVDEDPMRENEIVNYLIHSNYSYLIDDHLET